MQQREWGKYNFRLLDDGTYEARIVEYTKTLVIPGEHNGRTVSAVTRETDAQGMVFVNDILLSEGVIRITGRAFFDCIDINSVTLPTTLRVVEEEAFSPLGVVDKVYVRDLAEFCKIDFGRSALNPQLNGARLYVRDGRTPTTRLEIPEGFCDGWNAYGSEVVWGADFGD